MRRMSPNDAEATHYLFSASDDRTPRHIVVTLPTRAGNAKHSTCWSPHITFYCFQWYIQYIYSYRVTGYKVIVTIEETDSKNKIKVPRAPKRKSLIWPINPPLPATPPHTIPPSLKHHIPNISSPKPLETQDSSSGWAPGSETSFQGARFTWETVVSGAVLLDYGIARTVTPPQHSRE